MPITFGIHLKFRDRISSDMLTTMSETFVLFGG